jgi:predicted RecB family nuclease
MRLDNGHVLLSPTDLANHLACAHLTTLELAAVRGDLERPVRENPQAELIRRKGDEHELAYLARLRAEGREIVEIERDDDLASAAARTEAVLRAGGEVVYQGVLASGGWRGIADFLVRVDEPSALGPFSYEAWDTKLARHAKPAAVLQLTFYSHELERIQGRLPQRMHVVLGTGDVESFRPADFAAYFRRVQGRLVHFVQRGQTPSGSVPTSVPTYPYPVDHCKLCDFLALCEERWERDDHLVRVAGIRRDQIERLGAAGIATLAALGDASAGATPPRMAPQTFEKLRHQAALQLHHRRTQQHRYELLPPLERRGLGLLPAPSPGDLFYDIEGDPYWEPGRGLEYLHGIADRDGRFTAIWARDRDAERRALERVIDTFTRRRAEHPDAHVYHYASYETTALKRLVAEHSTHEEELDELLRQEAFVDLFTVVRQSLRISHPRYSIKNVRQFFMAAEAELEGGEDAIVLYERWLAEQDAELLEAIERYNEEDCVSTVRLADWLAERKAEAERQFGVAIPWREPPERREPDEEAVEALEERTRLREQLLASGDPALVLAGQLLEYHRREAKPGWWAYFERLKQTPEDLVDDSEAIGALEPAGPPEPLPRPARSSVYPLSFPIQQHKLDVGDEPVDPVTEKRAGEIVELDNLAGRLLLKRSQAPEDVPLPTALVPPGPFDTREQRGALARFARSLVGGDRRYPHLERILRREPPLGGARVQRDALAAMRELVEEVEGSYLFVQGPPGAGKTWTGARLIVHLLTRSKRVGIASTSHKAIHKLLEGVVEAAEEEGVPLRALKKASSGNDESHYRGRGLVAGNAEPAPVAVENATDAAVFPEAPHRLLAGTAWLFCREEMDRSLDYLFVDEAGQVSLADALALGTSARTLVLLGDPVQLAQVTQGIHPDGSGRSVLAHLLGEARATVAPEMGLFLERSWRMHPDVCRYVSSAFYEDRLEAAEPCAAQACSAGTGVRWLRVSHEGNATESEEEAGAIRSEIERLLAHTWTNADGVTQGLRPQDVMVVAPYNRQVRLLTERLQPGVRVGTVDKFQGQEAPVVFFSMAASSGEDAPRGIDFLMSRNRLNVAVSRAQCLAYLACSPRLLEVDCKTIEHMRLANALCRFVELARPASD